MASIDLSRSGQLNRECIMMVRYFWMFGTNYMYAVEISIIVLFCFCFDPVGISTWCTVINSSPGELIILPECQNKIECVLNITSGKSNSSFFFLFYSKSTTLWAFQEKRGTVILAVLLDEALANKTSRKKAERTLGIVCQMNLFVL